MRPGEDGHVNEDRLIDLAAELLDPDGRAETVAHLRACAACEKAFQDIRGDAESLRTRPRPHLDEGRIVASARTTAGDRKEVGTPAATRSGNAPVSAERRDVRHGHRRTLWRGAAVAAIVLIGVLTIRSMRQGRGGDLEYWYPLSTEAAASRSGTPPEEAARLAEAAEAYRRKDTRRVVALLEGISIPPSPMRLVQASALCQEKRYEEALRIIDGSDIPTLPPPARDRARWIRYIALRGLGKDELAVPIARELAARPGEFSADARRELARR